MNQKSLNNYAVFILTNGRPHKQYTTRTLHKLGYTGSIYYLCDTDDPTLPEYKKLLGKQVVTFDKRKVRHTFDLMTNEENYNLVVYARNAVFKVAKRLGLDYIVVMDDDYTGFYTMVDENGFYQNTHIRDFDKLIRVHLKFLKNANLDALAFAQAGDFLGGENGGFNRRGLRPLRKVMNVFFFDVDKPLQVNGMLNEDSVLGVDAARHGKILLTTCLVKMLQKQTQTNSGGLTEAYKSVGTYQKSFYSVLMNPSAAKIEYRTHSVGRIHHHITGRYAYPKIVSEKFKKQ